MPSQPIVAVHGGASAVPKHLWEDKINGVKEAAKCAYKVLQIGGTALDASEKGVISLEDNPHFNAGRGSALTLDGEVEMDALIMEGQHMGAGAVAAIRNIPNPIKVARKVLEFTPHVLLVGYGAQNFATLQGIQKVNTSYLITEEAQKKLEKYKIFETTVNCLFSQIKKEHDTVGCIALDDQGHVASGTSTGGITAKLPGRVGDSPLVGCGGIADDEVGAVSTTGHGESITRTCLAKTVLTHISAGNTVSSSIKISLDFMERRISGFGGVIALSSSGDVGIGFSTERMAWAFVQDGKLHYGLHKGQHEVEDLS